MRRSLLPIVALLVAACAAPLAAAQRADMATAMPADTAVYMGWSQKTPADDARLQQTQQICTRLSKLLEDEAGPEIGELAGKIVDGIMTLHNSTGGVGLMDVVLNDGGVDIQALVLVDAGDGTDQLAGAVQAVAEMISHNTEQPIGTHTVHGVEVATFTLQDVPLTVSWGRYQDYFFVSLSDVATEKVLAVLAGDAPSLADSAELKLDRNKVQAQFTDVEAYACIYVDAQRVVTRACEIATEINGELPPIVDTTLEALGIKAVRSKYVHVADYEDRSVGAAYAHIVGERRGLLALWNQKPLTDDDIAIVPENAYWAEVTNLDLIALWQEVLRTVEAISPETAPMVQGSVGMASSFLGLSITDQLLPAFGDTWAFFDAPSHGGILLTGTVLVAEVRDQAAIQQFLTRIVQMAAPLAGQANEELKIESKETAYEGRTIYYVSIGGVPSPVAPAWTFVGDRCIFGVFPQTVAAAARTVDPKTRGKSILDHPAVVAARKQMPRDAMSFGYVDSQYLMRLVYPLFNAAQLAGTSFMAPLGVELDLNLMPPVDTAVGKVRQYIGTTSSDADGILYRAVGDGSEIVVVGVASASLGTSILLPSLARAREIAKRAVSSANLKQIAIGMMMYAHEHDGHLPPSLDEFMASGVISDPKLLESPRAEGAPPHYIYISGQSTDDDFRNVLAYEQITGDEGTNVVFLDGHVEWMRMPALKRALRETYARLEREEELPGEFQ